MENKEPVDKFMECYIKNYTDSTGVYTPKRILDKLKNSKTLINLSNIDPYIQTLILNISKTGPNFTPGFFVTKEEKRLQMLEFLDSHDFFNTINKLHLDISAEKNCNIYNNIDFDSISLKYKIIDQPKGTFSCKVSITLKIRNSNMSVKFKYIWFKIYWDNKIQTMAVKYILFCIQESNFQTRSMLIPYDKIMLC